MGGERSTDQPPVMDYVFESGEFALSGHLAEPEAGSSAPPGLVLCHGFPTRGRESPQSGKSFPELADRIAAELGWLVLTMNFRGCGGAEGDFSLLGWLDDLAAAVAHLQSLGTGGVWLAGVGSGGSLAIVEGARNPSVRGVAAMAAPADFEDWARHPRRLLLHARQVQVIKDPDFPEHFDRWAAELKAVRPTEDAAALAPRPLLVLHGDSDDITPLADGHALADAHGSAEMRVISGAGHELRHDPRAVAVFLGWLRRQRIAAETEAAAVEAEEAEAAEIEAEEAEAEEVAAAEVAAAEVAAAEVAAAEVAAADAVADARAAEPPSPPPR